MNLPTYVRKIAIRETKEWFHKNGSCDFKLVGFYDEKIIIVLSYGGIKYLIQIEYHHEYPYCKKEHKILQILPEGVSEFKFVSEINAQCIKKNISLTQIFVRIFYYLKKFKQIRENGSIY